jgi:hypothetical protein
MASTRVFACCLRLLKLVRGSVWCRQIGTKKEPYPTRSAALVEKLLPSSSMTERKSFDTNFEAIITDQPSRLERLQSIDGCIIFSKCNYTLSRNIGFQKPIAVRRQAVTLVVSESFKCTRFTFLLFVNAFERGVSVDEIGTSALWTLLKILRIVDHHRFEYHVYRGPTCK